MLMMEVEEQTVPGSLAGGTRGPAQQAWGNRLETDPQQMQESRNNGQQDVSHRCTSGSRGGAHPARAPPNGRGPMIF